MNQKGKFTKLYTGKWWITSISFSQEFQFTLKVGSSTGFRHPISLRCLSFFNTTSAILSLEFLFLVLPQKEFQM